MGVEGMTDWKEEYRVANIMVETLQKSINKNSDCRAIAVMSMYKEGDYSYRSLGEELGLSGSRVQQLVNKGRVLKE